MIKVIHVISDSNIGGAGRYLLTYLKNCNKNEFDVSVALPRGSKLLPEIEKLKFKTFEIDKMAEKSLNLYSIFSLYKMFLKEKPNIVHSHASLSARIAAKLSFKKIIYTRHSVFPQKKYITRGIGKVLNGLLGGFLADGIIAVAEAAKKNLTDTGINPKKIRVIYNGVNALKNVSDEEKSEFRQKYKINDNYVVAIIARLEEVKGHKYFIDTAEIVLKKVPNVKFVIAGTGSLEQELKEYADLKGIYNNIIFTGFLNNTEVLENVMDIQVNASFGTEAASLSLLEGMSIGKPAVVSDFGGNPELIKDGINGFVVPKQNANAMADKIIALLKDNDLRSNISKSSKEIFNEKFTSVKMSKNMEDFYLKIMGCKSERNL